MGYLKYLALNASHKFERFKDEISYKKLELQLSRFKGKACSVKQGEFNEETQEFEVLEEVQVSDLQYRTRLGVTNLKDGDNYFGKSGFSLIVDETDKIHLGDEGIVFTQDGYGRDILIDND